LGKRVLVVVWDGLRPDFVRDDITPNLRRLAEDGVKFNRSYCEFPSATRVSAASVVSGCHPGNHGIAANELYVPEADPFRVLSAGKKENLALIDVLSGGKLFSVPSVGEILAGAGLKMAVASSGSTGSAFVQNHKLNGPVIHPKGIYPEGLAEGILERFGPPPGDDRPNTGRNDWIVSVFCDYILEELRPSLAHLWLSDPDHTQHRFGLGSPTSLRSIREEDERLGRITEKLRELAMEDSTDIFVISDHGFSTGLGRPDLERELIAAGLKEGFGSGDVILGGHEIYVNCGRRRAEDIARFLQESGWAGAVFADSEVATRIGCFPKEAVWQTHGRSASLLFSGAWDDEPNEFGIRGRTRCGGTATHGTLSPYDMRTVMIARGPDFRSGFESDLPCGLIDIAPTVLRIFGIEKPAHMDGRVLEEALHGGPDPSEVKVEGKVLLSGDGRRELRLSEVYGASYLVGEWPT